MNLILQNGQQMTSKLEKIKLNMGEYQLVKNYDQEYKDKPYFNALTQKNEVPLEWEVSLHRSVTTSDSMDVTVYAHTKGEAIDIVENAIEWDTVEQLEGGDYPERDEWDEECEQWEQITEPANRHSTDRDTYKERVQAFTNIDKCREVNPHFNE